MEAGWVVTEVGRQPWIVHNYMKVEDAATANTGVWITFLAIVAHLRRRRRHDDPRAARHEPAVARSRRRSDETDVPYGPSDPGVLEPTSTPQEVPVG